MCLYVFMCNVIRAIDMFLIKGNLLTYFPAAEPRDATRMSIYLSCHLEYFGSLHICEFNGV